MKEDLLARARALSTAGGRRLLGLTGPPGAGKSTLAGELVTALGDAAALVPMDGFHLADDVLVRLGRRGRKGAPDTFDASGWVALLRRLRAADEECVWAPEFRREVEDAVAGAIGVPRDVPLVVVEGNYLLLDEGPWAQVRDLLDEVWYVAPPDDLRVERLVARHVAFGKDPEEARSWVLGSDERNAALVAATRDRADLVVEP
ncbi:phosphoribulokinase/uridine kinase family protein [Motilibacter rhizosphaerae]|uniref:Phosphoribulokinase/uridine kinase family protein n=1 Tax=Motilibacter rhizosphaerae TaxID=598652 RepID=A0A4Q7NUP9_9ACTN|nr:nucleoside/nucleotide kinase family protein [Motilibacter rhizosphaerae]RZS90931.1 phosphoribulokinase/uridine kinase family protein [Motilibacter rhizosphaerae]